MAEPSKLYIYMQLSRSDALKVAIESLDSAGSVVTAKSAYTDAEINPSTTGGYQFRVIVPNVPVQTRVYLKPVSNPENEITLIIPRPAAALAMTQIYPVSTTPTTPTTPSTGTTGDEPGVTTDLSTENSDSIIYYNPA